ncbi:DUF2283 domain-containing protein [Actinoplanes bogorensis]|uniref:DUF2283 domain-containing protein n=1 Tax=Paractinoplanes bogorensis TaxID=1610840 RepID=A0ABS5YMR3_9ACTN|nr:DUF2283 domain-containing protein [Actinoplanes bogorensis]MBU2664749.1 DUF2283 domain-containing protein [Actinoplanes bogorensis]
MHSTYDAEADAAYFTVAERDAPALEQVVVERPGRGDIVLDFDPEGRLLGVEVIGARSLLHPTVLAEAEQL